MSPKIITQGLRFILVIMLISRLFGIVYSQDAQLTVPSDVRTETMILNPQTPACTPPCACAANEEGRIFYNDNDNKLYYCDGVNWKILDPEKTVATKIVSAYNSSGATRVDGTACLGNGTACSNPKADYTCDGTDDQVKINRAINSLPIDLNGVSYGVVYLLEGTYNISTALEDGDLPASGETVAGIIPHSNTALIGSGRGTVLKVVVSANFNVINASSVNRILISQLMIDGNRTSVTGTNYGISFSSVTYSKIDKVWVEWMSSNGIYLYTSEYNSLTNNHILNSGVDGIVLYRYSHRNSLTNNHILNSGGHGIRIDHDTNKKCWNNILVNNQILNNGGDGIYLNRSPNNIVSSNNIQTNGGDGIYLQQTSENNIVSSNNIQNNTGCGIYLKGQSQWGKSSWFNVISNNNIQDNKGDGIRLYDTSGNNIAGNVIYNNGNTGMADGIRLEEPYSESGSNLIFSNRIYADSPAGGNYGINIAHNLWNYNYLVGNLIGGTGYADRLIRDLGTGTKYTDKSKLSFEQAASQDPGSLGTISPGTYTYIPLNPSSTYTLNATTAITDGKSAGDLLILENINATNSITIPNGANTRLSIEGVPGPIPLSGNDTLSLIWSGNVTAGDWVEIGYSDN